MFFRIFCDEISRKTWVIDHGYESTGDGFEDSSRTRGTTAAKCKKTWEDRRESGALLKCSDEISGKTWKNMGNGKHKWIFMGNYILET